MMMVPAGYLSWYLLSAFTYSRYLPTLPTYLPKSVGNVDDEDDCFRLY